MTTEKNLMNIVDLHVHSNKSDGSFTPSGLVEHALKKGLSAFALTDHDTVDGLDEAILAAEGKPVEVIPGIEFSTEYEGRDVHVVGLFINHRNPVFQEQLQQFVASRVARNRKMCGKLREAGIDINYEDLLAPYPDAVITRAHYARYLLEHGYVKSLPEAFDRYVGDHCSCFVPREKVSPQQAVRLICQAEGLAVLAHPPLYHMSDARLAGLVSLLKEEGLAGIEALYPTYTKGEETHMKSLASQFGLCISGGSDFHGLAKPGLDMGTGYGSLCVPEETLTRLKAFRNPPS